MSFLIRINSYFAGTYQTTGDESEVRGELWECNSRSLIYDQPRPSQSISYVSVVPLANTPIYHPFLLSIEGRIG